MVHKPIETKDMSRSELAELPAVVEQIVRDGLAVLIDKDEKKGDS